MESKSNKIVDIKFSAHHAILEQRSSGSPKAQIFERQTHPFRNCKQILFSIIRNITVILSSKSIIKVYHMMVYPYSKIKFDFQNLVTGDMSVTIVT